MLKLTSKSIRILVIVGSLVLVFPISAILHTQEGLAINGSTASNSLVSGRTVGNSGKHPVRNCPMQELRTGLSLLSLKPTSKFTCKAPVGIGVPNINRSLPVHSSVELRNNPLTLEPLLSVLGILRI